MNTRDLQYFVSLVELKNYTQVAQRFNVSQPAVSQAIHRLEREFDCTLVEKPRGHRELVVTRGGQLLYEGAKKVNQQLDLTSADIKRAATKKIRFGLPPILGKVYIAQLVKTVPRDLLSRLKISDSGSHTLLTQLKRGDVDIAILGSVAPLTEEGINANLLAVRPYCLAVSEDHPLAKRQAVSFSELADERFISFESQYVHRLAFEAYCRYTQTKPHLMNFQVPDISWFKELIRQNVGVGLIVKDAVKNEPGISALDLTDDVHQSFYVSLAYREGYVLTAAEESLVTGLKNLELPN